MANYVYIATSLDGFIADANGGIDWLTEIPNPDGNDYGFSEFMDRVDAVLMGRKTFEQVLTFGQWPYTKKVFVLSRTLNAVPEDYADKAEVVNGTLAEILAMLKSRGYEHLYVDGGQTIQSFLEQDLINEMIITRIPVLLGGGIPLFGTLEHRVKFDHVQTDVLPGGMVKSRYVKKERS